MTDPLVLAELAAGRLGRATVGRLDLGTAGILNLGHGAGGAGHERLPSHRTAVRRFDGRGGRGHLRHRPCRATRCDRPGLSGRTCGDGVLVALGELSHEVGPFAWWHSNTNATRRWRVRAAPRVRLGGLGFLALAGFMAGLACRYSTTLSGSWGQPSPRRTTQLVSAVVSAMSSSTLGGGPGGI